MNFTLQYEMPVQSIDSGHFDVFLGIFLVLLATYATTSTLKHSKYFSSPSQRRVHEHQALPEDLECIICLAEIRD